MFNGVYQHNRVFITGHTGFKGAWLTAYLEMLGSQTAGFSRDIPTEPAHYTLLQPSVCRDLRGDINDFQAVKEAVAGFAPDIIFHLAAQPLVRRSYDLPLETFQTNVIGTVNVLEAAVQTPSVRAIVLVTTDKCYAVQNRPNGYRETDTLGGDDPYSASKACAEIAAASYRHRTDIPIATCRSGNAIGGGDWAVDRLFPEMVRSVNGRKMNIRMPEATRPWQFVLEPLHGYLLLGQKLLENGSGFSEAWNFGPAAKDNVSVADVVSMSAKFWDKIQYETAVDTNDVKKEAPFLMLDSSKAYQRLHWQPVLSLERSIGETIRWYKEFYETGTIRTREQIEMYCDGL